MNRGAAGRLGRRIRRASMTDETIEAAERAIGHTFADKALLKRALTHASVAEQRAESNERLEFLGDAVLGMVACDVLFRNYPDLLEGELTKIKSAVVSRRTCAEIADAIGLTELLSLGKGMQTHATLPASISAAVLEAVIGAIYLDEGESGAGLARVREFLDPHLIPEIERTAESGHQRNFKSVLQQHSQDHFGVTPDYVLLDEKGPDHAKCFEVCVQIGAERYESSWGQSKKQAEQQAALIALRALGLVSDDGEGGVAIVEAELETNQKNNRAAS